ncbi:MAG: CDP-alcohol phosphatidyltransferase family protein [Acidimicrobiia bacterium]
MPVRAGTITRAHIADGLTAMRLPLALLIAIAIGDGRWLGAAVLLALAWWTDFLDGRIAQATTGTRLGPWDGYADAAVGAGVLLGLIAAGEVPGPPFAAVGLVFALVLITTGNMAFGMLLQATGYAPFLAHLFSETGPGLAIVVLTIAAIAVLDSRRLFTYVLPTFFEGVRFKRN